MANSVNQVEPITDTKSETGTERTADGITVEIDTVAGPISIVRTTVKASAMMQHC
jgi:hypothetical protein